MNMRIGIVGCGLIGRKRAAAAAAMGHRVVAVADTDQERANALARQAGAVAFTQAQQVIEAEVDIVVVATSHEHLAGIAAAAAAAGRHVLLEKPCARSADELAPVIKAAGRTGVTVKAGFNHRFHPALLKARELVDSGVAGPLMFIRGRYGHGGRPGYEQEWRMEKERSGGGELIDQGAHLIDLSRWFLGDFTEADGWLPTCFWPVVVEDNCFLALRTDQGQMAWLHASWSEWKNMFSFEIYGRDAKIEVNGLGGSYGVERCTLFQMLPGMGPPETTTWEYPFPDRSWELELAELVDAIAAGRRPMADIQDAHAVLRTVDTLYRKAQR